VYERPLLGDGPTITDCRLVTWKLSGLWSASSHTEEVRRFAADLSSDREIARPARCPRRVTLELKREMNPNPISSTPSQVIIHPRSSSIASAMGTASEVAAGAEEATVSLAEGAVAKGVSMSTGRRVG